MVRIPKLTPLIICASDEAVWFFVLANEDVGGSSSWDSLTVGFVETLRPVDEIWLDGCVPVAGEAVELTSRRLPLVEAANLARPTLDCPKSYTL